jgi:hypothetical protein
LAGAVPHANPRRPWLACVAHAALRAGVGGGAGGRLGEGGDEQQGGRQSAPARLGRGLGCMQRAWGNPLTLDTWLSHLPACLLQVFPGGQALQPWRGAVPKLLPSPSPSPAPLPHPAQPATLRPCIPAGCCGHASQQRGAPTPDTPFLFVAVWLTTCPPLGRAQAGSRPPPSTSFADLPATPRRLQPPATVGLRRPLHSQSIHPPDEPASVLHCPIPLHSRPCPRSILACTCPPRHPCGCLVCQLASCSQAQGPRTQSLQLQ